MVMLKMWPAVCVLLMVAPVTTNCRSLHSPLPCSSVPVPASAASAPVVPASTILTPAVPASAAPAPAVPVLTSVVPQPSTWVLAEPWQYEESRKVVMIGGSMNVLAATNHGNKRVPITNSRGNKGVLAATTENPWDEFCREACEEGIAGPECDCAEHPIG